MKRRFSRWLVLTSAIWLGLLSDAPIEAQPSVQGEWTNVFTWGMAGGYEAIHVHLLPTGKVLFWQTWRESAGLWDPATDQFALAALPQSTDYNPFCAGHTFLADGRLLVVGGHIQNHIGSEKANIYDPFTNTWANNVPNMPNVPAGAPSGAGDNGRWYPSATLLGNGDVLVLSGDMDFKDDVNWLPQIYQAASNTWRNLTGAYKELPLYPRTFLAPDGRAVVLADYDNQTEYLDTTGTGAWSFVDDTLDSSIFDYGPAVMYDTGKVAYLGGGWNPTKNVSLLDLNLANPAWRDGAQDMAYPRRNNNATILADGTVLITGGSSLGGFCELCSNDPNGQIALAEIWDPDTEQVLPMASASSVYRGYHATSLLLPDGRVLFAGGNHDTATDTIEQHSAEIFSPAYLFKGPRPTVTDAPNNAEVGDTFFVQTPDGASIADTLIVVPGSVTHAQNWSQRANHLQFAAVDGGINITLPANANAAPPGYYMLFLVNSNGVPSIAEWLRVRTPSNLPGDFNLDEVVDAADYTMWRNGLGTTYTLADYNVWKTHFGESEAAGAAANEFSTVPEPAASVSLLVSLAAGAVGRRRRRRG
jgi:hypothetical protein